MRTLVYLSAGTCALLILFLEPQGANAATDSTDSSVTVARTRGETKIKNPLGSRQSDQPKRGEGVIYGAELTTAEKATLGLLVGHSLLTMREWTEVRIGETVRNQRILEVAKGKVCLAISQDAAQPPITRTPDGVQIEASAGTLLSLVVESVSQKSQVQDGEKGRAVRTATHTVLSKEAAAPIVVTVTQVKGTQSSKIVPRASGSTRDIGPGQAVRVENGVPGQPFAAPLVSCRAHEIQMIPVHTNTPVPIQHAIVQQQAQIASTEPLPPPGHDGKPAACCGFQPSETGKETATTAKDVQIPITTVPADQVAGATTRTTIQVRLP